MKKFLLLLALFGFQITQGCCTPDVEVVEPEDEIGDELHQPVKKLTDKQKKMFTDVKKSAFFDWLVAKNSIHYPSKVKTLNKILFNCRNGNHIFYKDSICQFFLLQFYRSGGVKPDFDGICACNLLLSDDQLNESLHTPETLNEKQLVYFNAEFKRQLLNEIFSFCCSNFNEIDFIQIVQLCNNSNHEFFKQLFLNFVKKYSERYPISDISILDGVCLCNLLQDHSKYLTVFVSSKLTDEQLKYFSYLEHEPITQDQISFIIKYLTGKELDDKECKEFVANPVNHVHFFDHKTKTLYNQRQALWVLITNITEQTLMHYLFLECEHTGHVKFMKIIRDFIIAGNKNINPKLLDNLCFCSIFNNLNKEDFKDKKADESTARKILESTTQWRNLLTEDGLSVNHQKVLDAIKKCHFCNHGYQPHIHALKHYAEKNGRVYDPNVCLCKYIYSDDLSYKHGFSKSRAKKKAARRKFSSVYNPKSPKSQR